jgi:hypothetical protein
LNVEKNLACLLQCNIVCFSGKDFRCLCDVRLQDFLILDFFSTNFRCNFLMFILKLLITTLSVCVGCIQMFVCGLKLQYCFDLVF